MNKPLPRSRFGTKYDENYDRIFKLQCCFCGYYGSPQEVVTRIRGLVKLCADATACRGRKKNKDNDK